ncbi:Site-specific recombinase XerD [Beijerinckiaceae bacterium RH AL1]|nr:site-specific integrase [Beijerinckiaceae bacterium]VVB49264.1 Site-specific recombinase XerD [Beijerinckiaceae bacterium RH CH11]VVB49343.1 Site-specific recombinase XerD [Beijerinckiaceae bacterium RH AL8]VVC56813.1 Site-specific recombinase XerD [Beijerinckiaceae bacterium RH AL1]
MAAVYKRGDTWWVRFRHGGEHIRRSAKTRKKAEAQDYLHRLIEEHRSSKGKVEQRHLLTAAIDAFFETSSLKASTLTTYRFQSRVVVRLMGHLHLDEIDRKALGEFVATRKRTGVTDATIRRDLAFLGSVFTAAIRRGWVDTSPVTAFGKRALKESRPRIRFVSREEFARLHDAASETLKPILVLAVETGMRKEELLSLQLEQIDLRRREVHLEITKTSSPRRVPLSVTAADTVRALIEKRGRPASRFLFCKPDGSRVGDPKKGFNAACRRAQLVDFRFHDLRHTFASWWVQDGGDLYRLSRVLGHATLQMTSRYGHLRTEDLHSELERVAQKRSQDRKSETIRSTIDRHQETPASDVTR